MREVWNAGQSRCLVPRRKKFSRSECLICSCLTPTDVLAICSLNKKPLSGEEEQQPVVGVKSHLLNQERILGEAVRERKNSDLRETVRTQGCTSLL